MLSQWFDPEPGPAAIPGVLARELVRSGHDVSVLTGYPNYPHGEIYDGFRQRAKQRGIAPEGYPLTRVALYPNHSSSALGRMANYASFALTATLLGRSALHSTDAIWVYNSPVTVTLPLLTHSSFGRKPIFLQVQDLWPDSLIESGMFPGGVAGRIAAKGVSSVVRLTENSASIVGVSSKGARALLLERNPRLDPARVISSPNPTDETLFVPRDTIDAVKIPTAPWGSYFTVMYAGAVGDVQGLESLVGAAKMVQKESDIHFVIVGDGIARERLQRMVVADKLNNVTFTGRVEQSRIPGFMATANVQLVSLADRPFLRYTTPSKIGSLLASRLPIIGQLSGDGAELIQDAGAGLLATPGDAASLADAVLKMFAYSAEERSALASSGRAYYEKHLSSAAVAKRVVSSLTPYI
jgi:colanic acid biosynthesis glycosyl transferase WcaI